MHIDIYHLSTDTHRHQHNDQRHRSRIHRYLLYRREASAVEKDKKYRDWDWDTVNHLWNAVCENVWGKWRRCMSIMSTLMYDIASLTCCMPCIIYANFYVLHSYLNVYCIIVCVWFAKIVVFYVHFNTFCMITDVLYVKICTCIIIIHLIIFAMPGFTFLLYQHKFLLHQHSKFMLHKCLSAAPPFPTPHAVRSY